eukprot:3152696-Alexandrium_andersonii.AAC.1
MASTSASKTRAVASQNFNSSSRHSTIPAPYWEDGSFFNCGHPFFAAFVALTSVRRCSSAVATSGIGS